jgi:hypothetical protein
VDVLRDGQSFILATTNLIMETQQLSETFDFDPVVTWLVGRERVIEYFAVFS